MFRLLLFLFTLLCTCGPAQMHAGVTVNDDPVYVRKIRTVQHLGRTHFKVRTATATYFYDPIAGGFSSVIDKLGNDWIAYRDDTTAVYPAAAATAYRGLPNLVFGGKDDGAGHPGSQKCESRVTRRNQITTVSYSGEWEWRWTFYRSYAKLEVLKTPADRKYWFLYEGPVGGRYLPRSTFWATDLSEPSYEIRDHYRDQVERGQFRYLLFGEDHSPYALFLKQKSPDTVPDHVSYLGNEEIGAANSPDGMIVAGFGRAAGATPLLTGPQTFYVGLLRYNVADPLSIRRARRRLNKLGRKR